MKGVVKMINPRRGMIAVEVDSNDFTVMEILEITYDVEIEDVISGNLDSEGGETMTNESKKEIMDVSVEAVNCTEADAQARMR